MSPPLLELDSSGLFCEAGGFHIDPWLPVARALITHGHSDHARPGSESYLCAGPGEGILRARLGEDISLGTLAWGETARIGEVQVSFHPAGHVPGSAQIRVEHKGEVWVVSGDYKLENDGLATPFESIRCHTFVTESTFGLPIYRWAAGPEVFAEINAWWRGNRLTERCSVIFAYPLGKSQRILAGVDASIGPIFCHGAIQRMNQVYAGMGLTLPEAGKPEGEKGGEWAGALVVAPPSAAGSPWMKQFGEVSTAFASGWMRIRGTRRRRSMDRGFVLSDHADWPGLQSAILETGAETVLVTHGYRAPMVRWLREQGKEARSLETQFEGETPE